MGLPAAAREAERLCPQIAREFQSEGTHQQDRAEQSSRDAPRYRVATFLISLVSLHTIRAVSTSISSMCAW